MAFPISNVKFVSMVCEGEKKRHAFSASLAYQGLYHWQKTALGNQDGCRRMSPSAHGVKKPFVVLSREMSISDHKVWAVDVLPS